MDRKPGSRQGATGYSDQIPYAPVLQALPRSGKGASPNRRGTVVISLKQKSEQGMTAEMCCDGRASRFELRQPTYCWSNMLPREFHPAERRVLSWKLHSITQNPMRPTDR